MARSEGPVGRWRRQISSLGPLSLQMPEISGRAQSKVLLGISEARSYPQHTQAPPCPALWLPASCRGTDQFVQLRAEPAERRAGWARACWGRGRGRWEPTSRGKAPRSVLQGRPAVWGGGQGIVTGIWRGGESQEASRTGDISSFPWVSISLPCLHFFRHFWIKGTNS